VSAVRPELDDGANICEEMKTVVPKPEVEMAKSPKSFETSSQHQDTGRPQARSADNKGWPTGRDGLR